jgi:hypothetical protein
MDFLNLLFDKQQPDTPKRIMTQTSKMFELDVSEPMAHTRKMSAKRT